MTHSDAGNYAAKHQDSTIPKVLERAIKDALVENRLSCGRAHQLALETGFSPADVGRTADLMEIRLSGCQLGLFGHEQKEKIAAAVNPEPELIKTLKENLTDGSLSCLKAWQIAADFKLKKTDITAACEAGKIKITPCQLGAF